MDIKNYGDKQVKTTNYLEKFDIVKGELVGKGTFSKVYDMSIGSTGQGQWVLKEHQSNTKEEHILAEKTIYFKIAQIKHPNCIKVFPIKSRKFEVIEKCSRGELFDQIFKTKLGFSETFMRVVARQLINSYSFILQAKYAHNDIKPENIVFDKDYNIKLIDFGSASPLSDCCVNFSAGTTQYFAPEKLRGHTKQSKVPYNNKYADIYSIGMVLFSVLMRDFFYYEDDQEDIDFRLSNHSVLELVELKTLVDKQSKLTHMNGIGKKILASMMEANPETRFCLDMLNKESIYFNEQFYKYLTITKSDLEEYKKEIKNLK